MRDLKVSKNSFDFGWIEAIEQSGRHDWYEPLRRRYRNKLTAALPVKLFCTQVMRRFRF